MDVPTSGWSSLSAELLLTIFRDAETLAQASRICRQWRLASSLLHRLEDAHPLNDITMRRLCIACPSLRVLRFASDVPITDGGGSGLSLLDSLHTISLCSFNASGERTLAALATLPALTDVDLSWSSLLTDEAIRNFQPCSSKLIALGLRGCRRLSDPAVAYLLRDAVNLTYLDMSFCSKVGDQSIGVLSSRHVASPLRTLSLRTLPKLTNEGASTIGNFTALTELDVSYCTEITGAGFSTWTQLTQLRVVGLAGATGLTSYWCARLLQEWSLLETLDLFNIPHLSDLGLCRTLPSLTRLRSLDISHNPLLSDATIGSLSRLTSLEDLSASGLSGVNPSAFTSIPSLSRLRSLGMHNNRSLPPTLLHSLSSTLTSLTQLGLRHCCMHTSSESSDNVDLFAGLRRSIRYLDLSYSRLGKASTQISRLESLESLHLCGCCDVTDETLREIGRLHKLHTLDLTNCRHITDEGLDAVADLSRLSSLQLHGCCAISDIGVCKLSRLSRLEALDLSDLTISNDAVKSLHLPLLRSINLLNVSGELTDDSLDHISRLLTSLTCLHLPLTHVRHPHSVAMLASLSTLQQLNIQAFDAHLLDGVASLTTIHELIICNVRGNVHFSSLATLHLQSLQVLKCEDVQAIDLLAGLQHCERLFYLSIVECPRISIHSLTPLSERAVVLQELSVSLHATDEITPAVALEMMHGLFPFAAHTIYLDGAQIDQQ